MRVNEADNGYIEVYRNGGGLGLCLIASILVHDHSAVVAAFRRDPRLSGLMLVYSAAAAIYSITEAGFRMIWIFLLLAVVGAHGIVDGVGARARRPLRSSGKRIGRSAASHAPLQCQE